MYEFQGKNATQWARELGINVETLLSRIRKNNGVLDETLLVTRIPYYRKPRKNYNPQRIGWRWKKDQNKKPETGKSRVLIALERLESKVNHEK